MASLMVLQHDVVIGGSRQISLIEDHADTDMKGFEAAGCSIDLTIKLSHAP
uniref:Uncharacterized protein n=1 Tax=Oryza sativa subsp. japonica TaxID=39947 RepID=Q69NX6_ORYSJ|nr:hypothetical protein [Oryza sativa Japonica Group]